MTITVPQGLAPEATAIAVATRVRWTYVAPTLLIYWIISMFDKSNISLVMADPKFLDEMQLNGQAQLLGWLASSMFISYSLAAPLWGWAVTRYGPRYATMASLVIWGLTCFWSALSASYGMLLTSRIGLGVGEAACYPVTLALVANWFALPSIRPANLIKSGAIEHNDDAPGRILKGITSVWRNHRFWLIVLAISCNAIFFWGWSIWLPTYLRTARHFSFSTSGYLMAAALSPDAIWSVILMICALCAQQVGISCAEMLMHSVISTADMGKSQGVRALLTQSTGALSPLMIGYILAYGGGGFIAPFAVLSVAVVISAGCMIALTREGF